MSDDGTGAQKKVVPIIFQKHQQMHQEFELFLKSCHFSKYYIAFLETE